MPEHSRPSPSSSSTSSFSKSGENEMEVFKNFVVIANTENSLRILDEGKRAGLIGQSYKWVLGKFNLIYNCNVYVLLYTSDLLS